MAYLDGCTNDREGATSPRGLAESGRCLPYPTVTGTPAPPNGLPWRPAKVLDDLAESSDTPSGRVQIHTDLEES